MRLKKIVRQADSQLFDFVRLRSDGIELDSLEITVDENSAIRQIEIRDNIEGSCALAAQGRLLHCTAWESEAEAQDSSHWSKHFTQRIGTRPGGMQDALRIFQNLERCINDTYLKHVLRIFPGAVKSIEFDGDLYQVYEPPRPPVVVPEPEEAVQIPKKPLPKRLYGLIIRSRLMAGALIITVTVMLAGSLYFYHRPPELPPKTAEMLKMKNADLLPMLRLAREGIDNALASYANQADAKRGPLTATVALVEFRNEQDFLDRLYVLDDAVQLQTYNERVLQNPNLSDFHKARILHRLYNENLMRVVSSDHNGQVVMVYKYLERQLNKADLSSYMLHLIHHFDGSAVAVEAHFIIEGIAEIQERLINHIYFEKTITDLCWQGKLEWHKTPNEAIALCETRKKYLAQIPADSTKATSVFRSFQVAVVERAIKTNHTAYRRADLHFIKALRLIHLANEPLTMEQAVGSVLRIAYPAADYGDIFRIEFQEMYRLILSRHEELADLRNQAALQLRIENLTRESDHIRSKLDSSTRAIANFKSLEYGALQRHFLNQMKKLSERQEKFSPKSGPAAK